MERYANIGGKSGIAAFETTDDSITIRFTDGAVYVYDYDSAGPGTIEQMKTLARRGLGLNSFISKCVKDGYAKRLR
jgi:hypothetical protein